MAADASREEKEEKKNPIVFFDLAIAGHPVGRVKMELFADVCPKTAENFRYFIFSFAITSACSDTSIGNSARGNSGLCALLLSAFPFVFCAYRYTVY
jgi:hypothetical protein